MLETTLNKMCAVGRVGRGAATLQCPISRVMVLFLVPVSMGHLDLCLLVANLIWRSPGCFTFICSDTFCLSFCSWRLSDQWPEICGSELWPPGRVRLTVLWNTAQNTISDREDLEKSPLAKRPGSGHAR